MKQLNKIIFFIEPSGSGKDTFFYRVREIYDIQPITLLTTRPMRDGEQNGREYIFITPEKMEFLDQTNQLIERRDYDTQYGIWTYATGKQQIDLNNYNYLTPNTWVGYSKFLKYYSKEFLIPIYFQLNNGIRLERCL